METDKLELIKDGPIIILQSIKQDLQEIYNHYRSVVNTNDYLWKENERLKSEAYKDEELSDMKEKYDRMSSSYHRGFPISEDENKKITDWIGEQIKKNPSDAGAIGGRFIYEFIPTSIGTIGIVQDTFTKEQLKFQDLD